MQFTKIKATEKNAHLEWSSPAAKRPKDLVSHTLEGKEGAHPDFLAALQAFAPEVLKLLELPKGYAENLTVTGLSLDYDKHGRVGVVITCQKAIEGSNSPFMIHTPHLKEASDEETGGFISDAMLALIHQVEEHAEKYVQGTRAQGELFAEAGTT